MKILWITLLISSCAHWGADEWVRACYDGVAFTNYDNTYGEDLSFKKCRRACESKFDGSIECNVEVVF